MSNDRPQDVADILEGMDTPTPNEVYEATREYDTNYIAAAAASKAHAGGGGGGSLPQGWTADSNDPANVNTNGGFQRFGSDGGFVVPNAGFIVSDSDISFAVNGDLAMGDQAITGLPAPTTDSEPATKVYVDRRTLADGESVQFISADDPTTTITVSNEAGHLAITGTDAGSPGFAMSTGGSMSVLGNSVYTTVGSGPVIPATPTAQDVADALVALGLATQA